MNILKIILGYILYHFFPRKKIILILSSMRSGSTLLKALLGEANDVSHINEYNFQDSSQNAYFAYYNIYRLSSAPIIILKIPSFYDSFNQYPILPKYEYKVLVLIRNPLDTVASMIKMNKSVYKELSLDFLLEYWSKTYENLIPISRSKSAKIVTYESLIENPKSVTRELFQFIGSKNSNGVSTYSAPKNGWEWGKDDGGDLIKTLTVSRNINKDYNTNYKQKFESSIVNNILKHYYTK